MRPALPPEPPTDVPPAWHDLLATLPERGRALVMGPADCGKTTLCWWLAGQLAARPGNAPVDVVDADVGQSRVGPPACVGRQRLGSGGPEIYFVGTTTPSRRPASLLEAASRACRAAETAGAQWTVVDTTGYIQGRLGVTLKQAKIKRLRPLHVVAVGDDPGLEEILAPWEGDAAVTVHRLQASPAAREKTRDSRTRWRKDAFSAWLQGANLWPLKAEGRTVLHAPRPELYAQVAAPETHLRGLLMGFSGADGRGLCLGLLHVYDFTTGDFIALCPEAAREAAVVDFGCLRLEPGGARISGA